ncbi:MAG: pyrroline-5-carboxylate reductase [Candidatus Burarchaeum sp.]|nr:pyrroline-5-carboxylate reductase [Candidatus Burarchaeum sp.]MDO8339246.1 pyrroline-5-carboxylate reductase [Candidatus Burarchaeum sp.]
MRVCIIGTGKMGSALAIGLARGGEVRPKDIALFDHEPAKARALAKKIGARAAGSAREAVRAADIAVLAVKPDAVEGALDDMGGALAGKLIVSIAAAVPLRFIESRIPTSARAAAAMPNIPMQVCKGMGVYCLGRKATRRDAETLRKLFSSVGQAHEVKDERLLDAAIVSGSGNAFVYMVIDAMAKAGEKAGLGRRDALKLAASAAEGAGAMARESGLETEELIALVATKKGITAEGLEYLKRAGVHESIRRAMLECIRTAEKRRGRGNGKK